LRTRLTIGLVAVFIPVFALILYIHLEALHDRRESRVQNLVTVDQTLAASIDGFARDLATFTQSAAITLGEGSSAGVPLTQQTYGTYFQHLASSYNVRSIFVTDFNGKILAGTSGNVGFDISTRSYFQALKGGAETVWSGGLAGQQSGQTTLAYGRVLKNNDGQAIGYIFVAFYPPTISDRLPTSLPDDAKVSLIDNGGVLLFSSLGDGGDKPTVDVSQSAEFKQAAAGKEVVIRARSSPVDEARSYGAFVPVPTTGWVVGITRPASAIDGPLNNQFRRNLAIVAAAFIGAFAAMLFISSRLSRPLTALAASADSIARGDAPVPHESASDLEVLQLQTAMLRMSDSIKERETYLARQANQLARLHASRNALSPLLPPDQICAIVTVEAIDAIGAIAGAVLLPTADRKTFRVAAHAHYSESVLEALEGLSLDRPSPFGDAFSRRKPVLFSNAADQMEAYPDRAALKANAGTEASAFLPLIAENDVLGVLVMGFDRARAFEPQDVDLMVAFASQAAQSVHRSMLFDAAERANEAKDEFLGIVAHELRTPVASIYGGSRLLNDPGRTLPSEARQELMQNIEIEADRMATLVENLLLLARAELGREPDRSEVSLDDLLATAENDLARSYPLRDLHIENKLGAARISTDPTAIRQVLLNLLNNAAKYSPPDLPIDLRLDVRDDGLEFHVLDRGPGVKPEELNLIFESFYRSPGTARKATGKGIGLAVCRRLVQGLGGTIAAQVRPGGGLDIGVVLPHSLTENSSHVPAPAGVVSQ